MTAGDLRLKLTLTSSVYGVVSVTVAPDYTVFEVEMMLDYTDMASDAAHMASQSNLGGYMISFDSFTNYASALETNANNMTRKKERKPLQEGM